MNHQLCDTWIFVLHVRTGYEDRALHVEKMMRSQGLEFEYILQGDIADIDTDVLQTYFTGHLTGVLSMPQISCAYKHLLAYQEIMNRNLPGALILEDDICLSKNFTDIFRKSMAELKVSGVERAIISYEDTRLRFVPRSKRIKGQVLYEGDRDRMAGAYYISRECARYMLAYVVQQRLGIPIDWLHCQMLKSGEITYYWCSPTIATQGSHNGLFHSALSEKTVSAYVKWQLERAYKQLLYWLR